MDTLLGSLERAFRAVDERSRQLLGKLSEQELFLRPDGSVTSMKPFSCGEYILRSAGAVEQTFDGITTRMWDDPFEWTLPERLSTRSKVVEYLDEVEATRVRGFSFFTSDADLSREIPAPETVRPLSDVLVDTLARASDLQGRALAIYQVISACR